MNNICSLSFKGDLYAQIDDLKSIHKLIAASNVYPTSMYFEDHVNFIVHQNDQRIDFCTRKAFHL